MANIIRMEQGQIQTDKGPFNIPFIYIDAPLQNDVPSISYRLDQFRGIKQDFFYDDGVGLNCSIGTEIEITISGSNVYARCGQQTSGYSTSDDVGFSGIIIGTDDYKVPWTGQGWAGGPVGTNVSMGIDASKTPVSSSAFGTYTWTSTYTGYFSKSIGGNIEALHYWANYLLDHQPIVYEWTARDQIAGNGGQYRCDLTKIKDDSIGDFSAIQSGDNSDFNRISAGSSLWNIYHNMEFGETRKVAWSGANYMTMTLNELPSYPTQHSFTFKFYNIVTVGGEQVPSLIWQDEFPITITGQNTDIDFYLSFVYDADEEVAIFLPVTKDITGTYEWGWSGGLPTEVTMQNLYTWLLGSLNPGNVTPYSTGTEDNGGTPGGSLPQSHIDVPTAPTLGGMTSKMFTLYCPTETQLEHIAEFLWSDGFIDNIKKYFNNVSDNIMALYVLPYKPSNNPTKAFKVGSVESDDSSLAAVEYVDARFVTIDMGSITDLKPFWGSYLDYAPYSSIQLVLPGIGVQQLDVDDLFCPADMDGNLPAPGEVTIHLDYTIDLLTGVLVAFVSINGEVRYQFPGKIGYQIPMTGENYTRMAQGFVTAAAGLIGMVASGGTAAPFAAPAATAGIINAMKPDVYRGGNLSGDASMLARTTPTLIYRRPNKPLLEDQEEFTGFPSYKIGLLSEFSGYTEVLDAHVEGISCTDEERDKILAALKGGVII